MDYVLARLVLLDGGSVANVDDIADPHVIALRATHGLRSLSLLIDPGDKVATLESKLTVWQAGECWEETLAAPAVKRAACDLQLSEHLLECHVRTTCGEFAVD